MNPTMKNIIINFQPIALLNTKLKIFIRVLAKMLARVVKTCAIPDRSIHENLHFIRYSLNRIGKMSGKGGH